MAKKYNIPTAEDLFAAGVHYGHTVKKWNPEMAKYIYIAKKGMHIIDLAKTIEGLEAACEFLYNIAKEGGEVIFVGTKKQAKEIIQKEAEVTGAKHVTERWLGGTLTNFSIIKKSVNKLLNHIKGKESGCFDKYTKKERLLIDREIEKLQRLVGGIVGLNGKPKALIIVDAKKEKTAIKEANVSKIPVIAVVDTNTDPRNVDYVIPGNDDAIRSIAVLMRAFSDALTLGYKEFEKKAEKADSKAAKEIEVKDSAKKEVATKVAKVKEVKASTKDSKREDKEAKKEEVKK